MGRQCWMRKWKCWATLIIFLFWVFLITFDMVDLYSCVFSGLTFGFTILFVNNLYFRDRASEYQRRWQGRKHARKTHVSTDNSPEHRHDHSPDANNNEPVFVESMPSDHGGEMESQFTLRTRTMYRKERMRNGMIVGVYGHAVVGGRWSWVYYTADDQLGFRITKTRTADPNHMQM